MWEEDREVSEEVGWESTWPFEAVEGEGRKEEREERSSAFRCYCEAASLPTPTASVSTFRPTKHQTCIPSFYTTLEVSQYHLSEARGRQGRRTERG